MLVILLNKNGTIQAPDFPVTVHFGDFLVDVPLEEVIVVDSTSHTKNCFNYIIIVDTYILSVNAQPISVWTYFFLHLISRTHENTLDSTTIRST